MKCPGVRGWLNVIETPCKPLEPDQVLAPAEGARIRRDDCAVSTGFRGSLPTHGRFLTGSSGASGRATVKDRRKGHWVFSNWRTLLRMPRKLRAITCSSYVATGSSILQKWGRRICSTNLLLSSSTHQHWLLGNIGCKADPPLRKATEPGARYTRNVPVAPVSPATPETTAFRVNIYRRQ